MSRKDNFIVIGHRGSSGLKLKNIIPAFVQQGVQIFPCTTQQEHNMEKILKYNISAPITNYSAKAIQLNNESKL